MGCGMPPAIAGVADLVADSDTGAVVLILMGRVPQPTQAQVHTFTTLTWGLLLVDALLGVAVLRGRWRGRWPWSAPSRPHDPPLPTSLGALGDPSRPLHAHTGMCKGASLGSKRSERSPCNRPR